MKRLLNLALGTLIAIAAVAPAHAGITISGQVPNSKLTDIAALAVTDSNVIVGNGTTWVAESGATARTSLGVAIGTDVQAYNATLAAVAGGTYTGDDSIATVGTITSGTWNAGAVTSSGGISGTTGTFTGAVQATGSVTAVTADGNAGIVLTNAGVAAQSWSLFGQANGGNNDFVWYRAGAGGATKMILDATGSLTIDAATWTDNGSIGRSSHGTGTTMHWIGNQSITTSSDRRIKTDIQPSKINATEAIKKLGVVDFRWDDRSTHSHSYNGRKRIPGLIAQEVVKVLPMFVNTNGHPADGPLPPGEEWKIDYPAMVPVLVKALQEEVAKREALEARLAALERPAPATGSVLIRVPGIIPAPAARPTAKPKPAAKRKAI